MAICRWKYQWKRIIMFSGKFRILHGSYSEVFMINIISISIIDFDINAGTFLHYFLIWYQRNYSGWEKYHIVNVTVNNMVMQLVYFWIFYSNFKFFIMIQQDAVWEMIYKLNLQIRFGTKNTTIKLQKKARFTENKWYRIIIKS